MTTRQRTERKASKLEMRAIRKAISATETADPFSYTAVRRGAAASRLFAKAQQLRLSADLQEKARKREQEIKRRKVPKPIRRDCPNVFEVFGMTRQKKTR